MASKLIHQKCSEPLSYLHGHQNIISGLEAELLGKSAGESFDVTVAAADGYGEVNEDLLLTLPREMFPPDQQDQLQPGVMFQGPHPDNQEVPVRYTIVEVADDHLSVNGNHPLAGKTLHFVGSVVTVRTATEDEQGAGAPGACAPGTGCC